MPWVRKGEIKSVLLGRINAMTISPNPPKTKCQTDSSGIPILERTAKNSADAWPSTPANTVR